MKGAAQSLPQGAQRPPQPWYVGWRSVHLSVAGAATLIVLGVIVAKLDALAWRRSHVPERDYTTFLFPCEARAPPCQRPRDYAASASPSRRAVWRRARPRAGCFS